jgi:hypothetical protein
MRIVLVALSLQAPQAEPLGASGELHSIDGAQKKRPSAPRPEWVTLGALSGSMDEIKINKSINQSVN